MSEIGGARDGDAGVSFDVVVPTLGRSSLARLLAALAACEGPSPGRVVLVDDRARRDPPLLDAGAMRRFPVEVVAGGGRGPAAARNAGWRAATAEWIAFLDDDVVPSPTWLSDLASDLEALGPDAAASQGRIRVPLPAGRRPTDWERHVACLEDAVWASADVAYRRPVLAAVGGFDERFRRAYREDSDLALRVSAAGHRLARGRRQVTHPVGPASLWQSVRLQAGNADDVLMRRLHGRRWRDRAGAARGRRRRHVATTVSGLVAVAGAAAGRPRLVAAGAGGWLAGTAELAWARIAPGPRTAREVAAMLVTSAALPAAATFHWLSGEVRHRRERPLRVRPDAVLLDRDGTLVENVPYNGDPERVVPMPGAREALERLRSAGVPTAVVSNQSGIGRGLLTPQQVEAVNRRVEELLGPLGPWVVCPHDPTDACGCRKPAPGLVIEAARSLGVDPRRCALVGDIGADVEAARRAGARPILVPNPATRPEEVESAAEVARDLPSAVELLIGEERR